MTSSNPNRSDSGETEPLHPGSLPSSASESSASETKNLDPKSRIRHKLTQIRREAEAARLEANAARLEASAELLEEMLERIDAGHTLSLEELSKLDLAAPAVVSTNIAPTSDATDHAEEMSATTPQTQLTRSEPVVPQAPSEPQKPAESKESEHRFQSWDEVRQARLAYAFETETAETKSVIADDQIDESMPVSRVDSPHLSVRAPRMPKRSLDENEPTTDNHSQPITSESNANESGVIEPVPTPGGDDETDSPIPIAVAPIDFETDVESEGPRRRPLALVVSGLIHMIVFFALAGFTLTTTMPKDQVALSASVSESSESAIETFQIESVEPMLEPTEVTPAESQYDVSDFGKMATVDVTSDVISAMSKPAAASALAQPVFNDSAKLQSLKSDSNSKMEFCGVEGGGNHFVYLVDSSGSMGDAFISARRALLESIDMLDAKQRFYVIFFDAKCDYMRINRADQDEPRSVYATSENKQKLKSWAMRVAMDRGKAPYEPLEYALQKLKPDVIFLLSDGEFPQGIEDLLSETNQVRNLFGDESPISIIHTISYYSREGEARMRRIAEKNHGQYRHVPKPASR